MRILFATFALLAASVFVWAQPPPPPVVTTIVLDCNWGTITVEAIEATSGREAGEHASDPSGDGHGPGDADQPRVGLANIIEQGNLEATCEFLSGL